MVLQVSTDQLKPYIPEFFEELKPLDTDLFGWKRKEIYVARKVQQIATYRCPLTYACQCKSMLRVVRTEEHVVVEIKEEHNSESHTKDTYKKLKAKHKSAWLRLFALIRLCLPQLFACKFIRQKMYPSNSIEVFSILFEKNASKLFLPKFAEWLSTVLSVHSICSRTQCGSELLSIGE